MPDREELFLGVALILLFASTICYVALGDALATIRRTITQRIFNPIWRSK